MLSMTNFEMAGVEGEGDLSPIPIIDFLESLIFMEWKIPYFIFTRNFTHQFFFHGLGR